MSTGRQQPRVAAQIPTISVAHNIYDSPATEAETHGRG